MAMLDRVLIPLDGSQEAESIVFVLGPVLQRGGSEIFLVRALPQRSGGIIRIDQASLREAHAYLRRLENRFLDIGVCAHAIVGIGPPTEVIESLAAAEEVTAIALTTSKHSWPTSPIPGSVMAGMLRTSTKPVVAMNPGHPGSPPLRIRKDLSQESVLVPLDRNERSRSSLPLAIEVADSLDAQIVLMRVVDRHYEKADALSDLQAVASRLNTLGRRTEIRIESGDPAAKILEACREEDLAFVVLAAHGFSGASERPFGTVTQTIMNECRIPVLAIHSNG